MVDLALPPDRPGAAVSVEPGQRLARWGAGTALAVAAGLTIALLALAQSGGATVAATPSVAVAGTSASTGQVGVASAGLAPPAAEPPAPSSRVPAGR